MVLAVPDGCRWKRTKRSGRESAKLYVSSGSTHGVRRTRVRRREDAGVIRIESPQGRCRFYG
ncbi:MAG: hypothetical protein JXA30_06375, partial [Deltaproteobacteria bacterium]|nr:hypothetical protein [Deltaproteobacteria bacterium]